MAALAKCGKRSKAQVPLMKATAAGMKDWKSHQTFMQRNALPGRHPIGGQATWLKQYKAAPKNINAFKKADRTSTHPSASVSRLKCAPLVHIVFVC